LLAILIELENGVASTSTLVVDKTLLRVTSTDGRLLTSPDLIGAVLEAVDETGQQVNVRIDAVMRDPSDPEGDVWLHRFSVPDRYTGGWREMCDPGPDGVASGFPIAGVWTSDGRHERGPGLTITCTSGVIGKCVRIGYKPWKEVGSISLWDYHQACVRAVRADYGGDGIGHTRPGTLIEIFDHIGIHSPEPDPLGPPLRFEAAWGPAGAVCVGKTRIPELLPLNKLPERYPHLAGKIGSLCSEAVDALIFNRS
jgi:hypothetical protein